MKKIVLVSIRMPFALLASILVFFSSVSPYIQNPVYAQEASDSAQVSEIIADPDKSQTITPTQMPQKKIDKDVVEDSDVKGAQTKLEESPITLALEESEPRQTEASSRMKRATRIHDLVKKTFKQSESIILTVEKDPENDLVATMISQDGKREIVPLVKKLKNDTMGTVSISPSRQITPGAYSLEIKDTQGETKTYDILWGVLAINTNKSVYSSGEKASLAIAVLDEMGEMVCDADVKLSIKDPAGKTEELSTNDGIVVTGICDQKLFTMEPDYKAEYQVGGEGKYEMTLTATTKNGTHTILDSFTVSDSVPFDVERTGPTRTYPINEYPVTLTVTARTDFKGRVTDLVPDSFDIAQQDEKISGTKVVEYGRVESRIESPKEVEEDVLGASTTIVPLKKPFEGDHPMTLGYGEEYHADGLVEKITNALNLDGHEGVDFDMPKGTSVFAAAGGKVIVAGEHDYGLTVTIEHAWGKTYYGHLSEVLVKEGDEVKAGQEIALSGSTGESTGPHLHFGMRHQGELVDPLVYLPELQPKVLGAATSASQTKVKEISWDIDIKKGETIKLGYRFKSPPDSPRLYLLGKAKFEAEGKVLFEEKRSWQLAVDALSTVVDGTNTWGTAYSGQRKVVRTTYGTNGKRTFVIGGSTGSTISLYYTDNPDATTPSWTTVGNVSTSLYVSADMEWDSTNSVLYIAYGRDGAVDADTSDIKYKMVTALGTTPVLGTERDALSASTSLNYTHPLITIAQDSGTTKVFVFATGRTDTANPARISLRTGTINSDNPTWDTLFNVKTWTATSRSGNVSLARMNTDKTILFYHDNTNFVATRHDDSADAHTSSGWDQLDGTNAGRTTISSDVAALPGGLLGSSVGHSSSDTMWFAWLDSSFDINTRYWNGSSLDTEMVPVALADITVGPALSMSADNATLYMTYQKSSDATILVTQSRSASDGTTSWGGSETTIEDHTETLAYPSAVERLTTTRMDVVYTTQTTSLIRHAQPFAANYVISGSVKGTDESSFIGNPPCNGSTAVVSLRVNGGTAATTTCNSSTGAYSFSGVSADAGDTIYVYLNSSSTPKANMVMVSDEATHSDVDLYSGAVIVRDDQDGTITSADMTDYDNDQNATDMLYDAETSTTFVDTDASSELHVWTGDTFAPGGNSIISGSIHNAGTMTWSTFTTTFDATNSGNYLSGTLNGSSGFYKVTFNGSGGSWTIKDAMLVSKANGTDTLDVTAGTVTLGNGGGDNLDVRGKFTIAASAVFQTMTGLAQGDNTVCNSDDICIEINANSSPPSCTNCTIELSGTLDLDKNTTMRFNSNASVESGINVASTGYLEVKGTQDDTDNSGIDSQAHDAGSTITLSDASQSWTTNQHQYKYLRITNSSSLAYSRMYQISSNAANTITIPDNNNTEDTGASISGSGNSRTITSSVSLITADNEGVGQVIYNSTDDTYFLIIDSTNNASTDTFKIIATPSSFPGSLAGKTIKIDDAVRAADTFEILDFAAMTANATNNGFVKSATGSETVLKYGEFSEMGAETSLKYGVDFEAINGSNSSEGVSVSYSYIHDSHRSIRFDSSSHVNRSYTVQGESQGIMYNYIKDASQDGINASSSNSTDIIGNRIQTVTGNKDCLVVWTGAKNLIADNILTSCDPGIYMDTSGGNYVVGNKVYNSTGTGITALGSSSKNIIVGNSVFETAAAGINLAGSSATTTQLLGNTVDVAATYGLSQANTTASTIVAANESYGYGVGNTSGDVEYAAAAHTGRFYNSRFGSSTEVSGITTANSYLASWKHDQTAGLTEIWNDYVVPDTVAETPQSEETNKFNYADSLWEDSFTPSMLTGTGTQDNLEFSFSGGTLGGSANQYAYALRCKQADCSTTTSNAWDVYRDGVDVGDADTATQFTDSTTSVRFKIDDNGTNYARGDLYLFAAYQDSGDTNTQKTLTMMTDADTFTVGSGETVELKGQSTDTNMTQVTRSAGGYKFTIQSGGEIDASSYAFDYMGGTGQTIGLELQTGATVTSLTNGNFDNFVTDGTNTTYLSVASGIIDGGSQTWSDMVFDDTTGFADFNATLSGTPSSCATQWTFESSGTLGGVTNGEANDSDVDGSCSGMGYLLWEDPSVGGSATIDLQMRHGKWFSSGIEQGFTF